MATRDRPLPRKSKLAALGIILLLLGVFLQVCGRFDQDGDATVKTCEMYPRGEAPPDCPTSEELANETTADDSDWMKLIGAIAILIGVVVFGYDWYHKAKRNREIAEWDRTGGGTHVGPGGTGGTSGGAGGGGKFRDERRP